MILHLQRKSEASQYLTERLATATARPTARRASSVLTWRVPGSGFPLTQVGWVKETDRRYGFKEFQ